MKNVLFVLLIFCFSLTFISCAEKDENSIFDVAPSAPSGLTATGGAIQVKLNWTASRGASSYNVYWDNATGVSSSSTAITGISTDYYTHSGLEIDKTYYYKVAAVNSSGTGTLSSVASALLSANIQGSETYNAHTYAMTSAAMTFAEAKAAAVAVGGYLTTVNTKAENTFLTEKFYAAYGNKALWIGANDIATSNTWVWDNGTTSGDNGLTDDLCGSTGCPVSDATWADNTNKWAKPDQNPNGAGASCGYIWYANGGWDDVACSNNKYAIIEFDL